MADNKQVVLELIADGNIQEALEAVKRNKFTFTEQEIATHIDNIISENENDREIDNRRVQSNVELLQAFEPYAGQKADAIKKHLNVLDFYLSIEVSKVFKEVTSKESDYFNRKSFLSQPTTFFNTLFQSDQDQDISTSLKALNLLEEEMKDVVIEFLSENNNIKSVDDKEQNGHDSKRKDQILKSLLSVYGDKLKVLEGDYAGYLLVEAIDELFVSDHISTSDIALVKKLYNAEFIKNIDANSRALSKKIAKNIYVKYEERKKWHADKNDASSDALDQIRSLYDEMVSVEGSIKKTDDKFELSNPDALTLEMFKGTKVEKAAQGAFDFAAAAQKIKDESGEEGEYHGLVSHIKDEDDITGTEEIDAVSMHHEFLKEFASRILGVTGLEISSDEKKTTVKNLVKEKADTVKKISELLAFFQEEHKIKISDQCIIFTPDKQNKDIKKYIALDESKLFPAFKNIENCKVFMDTTTVEALNRNANHVNPINEMTVKQHEVATVILQTVALFQPDLLGNTDSDLLDMQ